MDPDTLTLFKSDDFQWKEISGTTTPKGVIYYIQPEKLMLKYVPWPRTVDLSDLIWHDIYDVYHEVLYFKGKRLEFT